MSTHVSHASSTDPRKKANGFLKVGKKMVAVFVGDDAEPFTVHRDLITATSYFFSKALSEEVEENEELHLPNHKSEHFAAYVQWLYEGRFESTKKSKPEYFMDLLFLGIYLQDRHFRNRVTDSVMSQMIRSGGIPIGLAVEVYPNLPSSSPWRKLVIDIGVSQSHGEFFKDDSLWDGAPLEFWFDVTAQLLAAPQKRGQRPWVTDRCRYYEHMEGEAKCI
ncbi:hypothetical protein E6O75_ATG00703 [Venturia nashicola]|uniref:BTB domain-containing protein n=1 Tax=Venturia nashicola TaxID=86259 RepID=A0A4Z1PH64_9PEZI|nr:hypothetical protein E6O75_ATG00703 [Venturia nashicola]